MGEGNKTGEKGGNKKLPLCGVKHTVRAICSSRPVPEVRKKVRGKKWIAIAGEKNAF